MPTRQESGHGGFLSSLLPEGAIAQWPKTFIADCQRKKGVCVCVYVCFGVGEREDSKLHNSNLENSFHL